MGDLKRGRLPLNRLSSNISLGVHFRDNEKLTLLPASHALFKKPATRRWGSDIRDRSLCRFHLQLSFSPSLFWKTYFYPFNSCWILETANNMIRKEEEQDREKEMRLMKKVCERAWKKRKAKKSEWITVHLEVHKMEMHLISFSAGQCVEVWGLCSVACCWCLAVHWSLSVVLSGGMIKGFRLTWPHIPQHHEWQAMLL